MFPIKAKQLLPVEYVVIRSVAVRGMLGPMTVWVSNENIQPNGTSYQFPLRSRAWTKIYDKEHAPSFREYKAFQLETPIILRPGQVRAIYIHSTLQNDDAIVYDNSRSGANAPRHQDAMVAVYPGKAHLSFEPFGTTPIWGWGNAWRDHREFVGRLEYGCVYQLYTPRVHHLQGDDFRRAVIGFLSCQRHYNSPVSMLPDECLYYILNMCRWDWFMDTPQGMKARRLLRKRRLMEQQAKEERRRAEEESRRAAEEEVQRAAEEVRRQAEEDQRASEAAAAAPVQPIMDEASSAKRKCCNCVTGGAQQKANDHDEEDDDDEDFYDAEAESESDDDMDSFVSDRHDLMRAAMELDNDDDENDSVGDGSNLSEIENIENDESSGSGESDDSEWEHANGYRANTDSFRFQDVSSDEEDARPAERADLHQPWFHRNRNMARIHVLRAIGIGNQEEAADEL
jgi:hypothetical protein